MANAEEVGLPIGIFDSGFGGLTVARAVVDLMPNEDIIYLGDTARAPYGSRSINEVRSYSLQCLDRLYSHGVKALLIACNTASAVVLKEARQRYDIPVFEVVAPAARRALHATKNRRIGVICTQATAASHAYDDALDGAQVEVHTQPCPTFVEFVEAGITSGPTVEHAALTYLIPIRQAKVDTVILGCTHYPLLTGVISQIMGDAVTLVSSADACAVETYRGLRELNLLHDSPRQAQRIFYTTGDPELFGGLGRRLVGSFVTDVRSAHIIPDGPRQ